MLISIIVILFGCFPEYDGFIIVIGVIIGMPLTILYLYFIIINDTEAFCEDEDGISHEPEYFLKK